MAGVKLLPPTTLCQTHGAICTPFGVNGVVHYQMIMILQRRWGQLLAGKQFREQ